VALQGQGNGTYTIRPPAQTAAILNRLFLGEIETEHYFTLLLADVQLDTGVVTMVQAGHPHPVVQRANGMIEADGPGGLPVGLVEGAEYQQFQITLAPGDRLMIHSDGIVECADPAGNLLGETGLSSMMSTLRQTRGMAFLESLIWKMADYTGDADFTDDVSAVLLEFKPSPIAI
jgi:sigma-B regulation protein RsbU (phosphoserine phosphatase)